MATTARPVLRVDGASADALAPAALAGLTAEALLDFLGHRRWFGAKGERPSSARVAELVPLPWGGGRFAIAQVEVAWRDGRTARWQLPLAVGEGRGAKAVLAEVEGAGARALLYDASEDAEFREALGRAFERGGSYEGSEGTRWVVEPMAGHPSIPAAASRLGSAEQSNTSIVYGDQAILKLFRRLERGENPDVEIGRYLTEHARFGGTPPLYGVARFEDRAGGQWVTAMLQGYAAGSTDAWSWALERGAPYFAAPRGAEPPNDFAGDAARLGLVTRRLHDALAAAEADDPAFGARAATADDVTRWGQATRRSMEQALALLRRRVDEGALPRERVAEARALLERRAHFDDYVAALEREAARHAGRVLRHHGDYHLGQVLRTPKGDFLVIDFEGEPARPLEERRERHSPLRDVAGMLRSFAYAAATLATEHGPAHDVGTRELRSARWEREARAGFLRGYFSEDHDGALHRAPRFLPDTREAADGLIALFETEKAFYELAYELNNRPGWVWIPMRGISRLLTGTRPPSAAAGAGDGDDDD